MNAGSSDEPTHQGLLARLREFMARGEWLDLASEPPGCGVLSGNLIREALLNIQAPDKPSTGDDAACLSSQASSGIRIRNGRIVGGIDLSGCQGDGGRSLPPLLLENCEFLREGLDPCDADVDVSDCCIRAVSLVNCRLSELRAIAADIARSLDVSRSGPMSSNGDHDWGVAGNKVDGEAEFDRLLADEALYTEEIVPIQTICARCNDAAGQDDDPETHFWINMKDARIGGDLIARNSVLRSPVLRAPGTFPPHDTRYALKLAGAIIMGSVRANDGSVFDGGINLHLAVVKGEVWLGGARLRAGEGGAFDAMSCDVGGVYARFPSFACKGEFNLDLARVRGSVILSNALLESDANQPTKIQGHARALSAEACRIEDDFILSDNCRTRGGLHLRRVDVGGDLLLRGARILGQKQLAVDLEEATVGGNLELHSAGCVGTVKLSGARIRGDLDANSAMFVGRRADGENRTLALDAMDLHVGQSFLFGRGAFTRGDVNLLRARIDGDLGLYRFKASRRSDDPASESSLREFILDLGWASVKGNLVVEANDIAGAIRLAHAEVRVLCDTSTGYARDGEVIDLSGFRYEALLHPSMNPLNGDSAACVSARLKWLSRMPAHDPQPYMWLSRMLARDGRVDEARDVFIEKQNRDRRQKFAEIQRGAISLRLPRLTILLCSQLFHWLFGDGLKPVNALMTLFFAAVLGAGVFWYANTQKLLVVDQQPVAASVSETRIGALASTDIVDNIWCGRNIDPIIYAIDVFVPLIDFRQESQCRVGAANGATRLATFPQVFGVVSVDVQVAALKYFKAAYSIAGWILVSLAIITFSGTLQRRLE